MLFRSALSGPAPLPPGSFYRPAHARREPRRRVDLRRRSAAGSQAERRPATLNGEDGAAEVRAIAPRPEQPTIPVRPANPAPNPPPKTPANSAPNPAPQALTNPASNPPLIPPKIGALKRAPERAPRSHHQTPRDTTRQQHRSPLSSPRSSPLRSSPRPQPRRQIGRAHV